MSWHPPQSAAVQLSEDLTTLCQTVYWLTEMVQRERDTFNWVRVQVEDLNQQQSDLQRLSVGTLRLRPGPSPCYVVRSTPQGRRCGRPLPNAQAMQLTPSQLPYSR